MQHTRGVFCFRVQSDSRFGYTDHGSANHVYSTTTANLGTWQHVAIVFDGSSGQMHVDGVPEGTDALDPMLATTYPVVTGARRDNGTTPMGHFDGAIDDLRVYPRALGASEVQTAHALHCPRNGWYDPQSRRSARCWVPPYVGMEAEWEAGPTR